MEGQTPQRGSAVDEVCPCQGMKIKRPARGARRQATLCCANGRREKSSIRDLIVGATLLGRPNDGSPLLAGPPARSAMVREDSNQAPLSSETWRGLPLGRGEVRGGEVVCHPVSPGWTKAVVRLLSVLDPPYDYNCGCTPPLHCSHPSLIPLRLFFLPQDAQRQAAIAEVELPLSPSRPRFKVRIYTTAPSFSLRLPAIKPAHRTRSPRSFRGRRTIEAKNEIK